MVMVIIAITILSIGTGAAMQMWTTMAQREKEAELIQRGFEYAEAIRVFQRRFGRYPTKLEELIKVEPRCIRQLYPNPMREDGEWALIHQGGPGTEIRPGQQQDNGLSASPANRGRGANGRNLPGNTNFDAGLNRNRVGNGDREIGDNGLEVSRDSQGNRIRGASSQPIIGVYAKAAPGKETGTFRVFMGQTEYDQWAFTVEMVQGLAQATPDRIPLVPTPRLVGRPWPEGVQPQLAFQVPGQGQGVAQGSGPGQGAGNAANTGVGRQRRTLPVTEGPDGRPVRQGPAFGVPGGRPGELFRNSSGGQQQPGQQRGNGG